MRSKAAIRVAPNTPLVIDEVVFPDPEPDQVLITGWRRTPSIGDTPLVRFPRPDAYDWEAAAS